MPTLNDYIRIAENGLSNSFYGTNSSLRKSVLKVIARVMGGIGYMFQLRINDLANDLHITTCSASSLIKIYGVDLNIPIKPECCSTGTIRAAGNIDHVIIPAGSTLVDELGNEYETVCDTDYRGDSAIIQVIAKIAGAECDLEDGVLLKWTSNNIPLVIRETPCVVVGGGIKGGQSYSIEIDGEVIKTSETIEEYRKRLLNYIQGYSVGGSESDYKSWAERFSYVSRCYVTANYPRPGCVTCTLANYNSKNIELNPQELSEVKAYLIDDIRRPITANVIVKSCKEKKLDFTIYITPDNEDVRNSVTEALSEALKEFSPGSTIETSALTSAIITSTRANNLNVIKINGSYGVKLDEEQSEIATVGEITFTSNTNG